MRLTTAITATVATNNATRRDATPTVVIGAGSLELLVPGYNILVLGVRQAWLYGTKLFSGDAGHFHSHRCMTESRVRKYALPERVSLRNGGENEAHGRRWATVSDRVG